MAYAIHSVDQLTHWNNRGGGGGGAGAEGYYSYHFLFTEGSYTKGTRAHTHREQIREWLWEPKGSFLEYI